MSATALTTALDHAHEAMEANPADDTQRLKFFERVAESELFLMARTQEREDSVSPQVFSTDQGQFVVAFDREERLAEFAGCVTSYVSLSGRALMQMLAGQGVGLGINLEVAPSSILLSAEDVVWFNDVLGAVPDQISQRPVAFEPPHDVPEVLITALDAKLALAGGIARHAYLVGVTYETGARSHMLAFEGALPAAQSALANAVNEAVVFSGIEAGELDVAFLEPLAPSMEVVKNVGLRFDLPQPASAEKAPPKPPGRDPGNPPILR